MGWQDMVRSVAPFSVETNAVTVAMAEGFARARHLLSEGK